MAQPDRLSSGSAYREIQKHDVKANETATLARVASPRGSYKTSTSAPPIEALVTREPENIKSSSGNSSGAGCLQRAHLFREERGGQHDQGQVMIRRHYSGGTGGTDCGCSGELVVVCCPGERLVSTVSREDWLLGVLQGVICLTTVAHRPTTALPLRPVRRERKK